MGWVWQFVEPLQDFPCNSVCGHGGRKLLIFAWRQLLLRIYLTGCDSITRLFLFSFCLVWERCFSAQSCISRASRSSVPPAYALKIVESQHWEEIFKWQVSGRIEFSTLTTTIISKCVRKEALYRQINSTNVHNVGVQIFCLNTRWKCFLCSGVLTFYRAAGCGYRCTGETEARQMNLYCALSNTAVIRCALQK